MAARKTRKIVKLTARQREDEKQLNLEEEAFHRQLEKLLKKYKNQFVAVYHGEVVDHDDDQSLLFGRVLDKLGDVPFLITRVSRKPMVFEGPSPEVEW
jgi:hypothetical protein